MLSIFFFFSVSFQCFTAGNTRVTENVGLSVLHILFHRQHDFYVDLLRAQNPRWVETVSDQCFNHFATCLSSCSSSWFETCPSPGSATRSTMDRKAMKSLHIEHWVICSSICSFARTAHSFACFALLISPARSFVRSFVDSLDRPLISYSVYPQSEETLFQEARKIFIAVYQKILFTELFPRILGKRFFERIPKYKG